MDIMDLGYHLIDLISSVLIMEPDRKKLTQESNVQDKIVVPESSHI